MRFIGYRARVDRTARGNRLGQSRRVSCGVTKVEALPPVRIGIRKPLRDSPAVRAHRWAYFLKGEILGVRELGAISCICSLAGLR